MDLNEETAYQIGRGFVQYTGAGRIVVGQDVRLSSLALFESLTKGITDQGADVYDIGEVPTECLYFAVGFYEYEAGIMITASHNPKEYNGFKMLQKKDSSFNVIRGKDVFEIVSEGDFSEEEEKGKIKSKDIWQDYLNHSLSFANTGKIRPFKVVIDAGNGMAGKVIPQIENKLPVKIIPLNFELDGNFPAHSPNPLMEESKHQISQAVKSEKADFGFIFDGDADRIFLVDEKGEFISADITLLVLARHFLDKNPGSAVAYNAICSKAVPEFIRKWGGRPIRTKVGFVNVREGMLKNNGIIGGELSGHYCFKDNFSLDSGLIAFLVLLQAISKSNKKVSDLIAGFSPYTKSSEINFEVENKEAILEKIKKKYSDGEQDYLDGVTVEYDNWWFNVRSSQTEPVLRLTIEAQEGGLLEEKKKELEKVIKP